MTKSKTLSWRGFVGTFGSLVIAGGLVLSFQACAPRSSSMCIDQATNSWVNCPEGLTAGSMIESSKNEEEPKKEATKKQATKKKTTTKKATTTKKQPAKQTTKK